MIIVASFRFTVIFIGTYGSLWGFCALDFCVSIIYLCGFLFPGLQGIQALSPNCSRVLTVIAQLFYWLYNNILNSLSKAKE